MTNPAQLRARVLSSLALAPAAWGIVYLGGGWFWGMMVLAAGIMAWEWGRVIQGGWSGLVSGLAVLGVMAVVGLSSWAGGFWTLGLSLMVLVMLGLWLLVRSGKAPASRWLLVGVPVIVLPCLALAWLRNSYGASLVYWLFMLTWASDSGAFLVGKLVGGARLAPRISPNKTWAGLVGGVIAAMAAGLAATVFLPTPGVWLLVLGSAALALVVQGGDLAESLFKRRFGVKDTGWLIPGHGGLLDRVDGLLALVLVVAMVILIFDGSGLAL